MLRLCNAVAPGALVPVVERLLGQKGPLTRAGAQRTRSARKANKQ
jgi:hypothetical protein